MQMIPPPLPLVRVVMESIWYMQWDFWVSAFTLALVLATLFLAWETRKMRRGSDAAMAEMLKHAETSANAAMASAKATQALVEVGQRPWISMRSMYLQAEVGQFHRAVTLYTTFRNSGATPAQCMRVNHYCLVTDQDFPENPEYKPEPDCAPIPISLAPNDEKRVLVQMRLADADVLKLINNEGRLYVFGVVTYSDTFGKEHHTKWCSLYQGGMYDDTRFSVGPRHDSME
jgi:hypothetical protein